MYRWVIPFYYLCHDKKLEIEDLYKCPKEDESDVVVEELEKYIVLSFIKFSKY
jgi:hypothetical protein